MHLTCPICRRELEVPEDYPSRPFCSSRCKLADLHNWLNEVYRVSEPLDADSDQAEEPEPPAPDAPPDGRALH